MNIIYAPNIVNDITITIQEGSSYSHNTTCGSQRCSVIPSNKTSHKGTLVYLYCQTDYVYFGQKLVH